MALAVGVVQLLQVTPFVTVAVLVMSSILQVKLDTGCSRGIDGVELLEDFKGTTVTLSDHSDSDILTQYCSSSDAKDLTSIVSARKLHLINDSQHRLCPLWGTWMMFEGTEMPGLFFKALLRRAFSAMSTPKPRRRRSTLRNSLEHLESRALLSAAGYDAPIIPAEVCVINAEISAPPTAGGVARRARSTPLFVGETITIDTPFGPVDLTGRQRGNRVRGQADLSGINVNQLIEAGSQLGVDIPPVLGFLNLPTVNFKGTFRDNTLNANFSTTVKVPVVGDFNLSGQFTGSLNPALRELSGHVTVRANGVAVLDEDFTATLPDLPVPLTSGQTPRLANVAGTHEFTSGELGSGTFVITQTGLNIQGVVTAPAITSGEFDAQFRTAKARKAKGTVVFQFAGQPSPETDRFFISFFKDGSLNRFRYR